MPKASGKHSSHLGQVEKQAAKTPGPGHFDLLRYDSKHWQSRGGKFVKCARDKGQKLNKTPACSQYNLDGPFQAILHKTPGGKLSKAPRGSHLEDCASHRSAQTPAPGRYDAKDMRKITAPSFNQTKNASKAPGRRPASPGPGHYKVSYTCVDERVPMWAHDKEPVKTFVDVLKQEKAKLPAPGHTDPAYASTGFPTQKKAHDQKGSRKHAQILLMSHDASHASFEAPDVS